MIDIAVAVGSVKSAIEIAKLLKDSADSFDKAEVKLKLAELIGSLADAKMQIAEIQEALMDSDQEKKSLLDKLNLKENLVYEKPYYWKKINEQDREGPFCQLCQDKDNKLIRLQELENNTWKCESCTRCYYSSTNQSRSCIVNISR
ncbi:MAG: hypothetical protein COA30_05105 [Sulfurimonas sp.]|nr:MAG: hypothetical protein COA30_05105 [Sulfurimonas sp.]